MTRISVFTAIIFYFPDSFFELVVALISLLGRYLRCSFFLLLAYRLLRFFIAFFLNLPKSVSLGLSVAYPRTDYCPLSTHGVSVYSARYDPIHLMARF